MGDAIGVGQIHNCANINESSLSLFNYVDITASWPAVSANNGSTAITMYSSLTFSTPITNYSSNAFAWSIIQINAFSCVADATNSGLQSFFKGRSHTLEMGLFNATIYTQSASAPSSATLTYNISKNYPRIVYTTSGNPIPNSLGTTYFWFKESTVGGTSSSGTSGISRSVTAGSMIIRVFYYAL